MKTKIKEALKTKYQNLGFGDKAIDGVADFLSRSVTKEEDIEATVTGAETLLKAFQGDADKRVPMLSAKKRSNGSRNIGSRNTKLIRSPKRATMNLNGWLKSFNLMTQ